MKLSSSQYLLAFFSCLVFLISNTIQVVGQDQAFITSSAGIAIPLGDFASNWNAELSSHVGLEGGYYFSEERNFGIGTKIAYSAHELSQSFNTAFENVLMEENIPYVISTTYTGWELLDWTAGVYLQTHFGEDISLEGKLRAGLLWLTSPEFSTLLETPGNLTAFNTQYSTTESVFNFNGEVVLKYNVDWLSINLYSSFLAVEPQINTTTDLTSNWPIDLVYRDTYFANVSIVTLGLGFEVRF